MDLVVLACSFCSPRCTHYSLKRKQQLFLHIQYLTAFKSTRLIFLLFIACSCSVFTMLSFPQTLHFTTIFTLSALLLFSFFLIHSLPSARPNTVKHTDDCQDSLLLHSSCCTLSRFLWHLCLHSDEPFHLDLHIWKIKIELYQLEILSKMCGACGWRWQLILCIENRVNLFCWDTFLVAHPLENDWHLHQLR